LITFIWGKTLMTQTDDNPNILAFTNQLMSHQELKEADDETICAQLRLHGAELIRLYQTGQLLLTEDVMQNLKSINASLRELDKPELPLDF
jgi:hypothetical protein